MLNKKGFLFVVTVFLILTYILLSISVWVKSVEASERAYAEFYKESTVELAIEQITPVKVDEVTSVVMNRALFRLNENAMESPVMEGPEGDENRYVEDAFHELLLEGKADERYFIGKGIEEPEGSCLNAWVSGLNTSLLAIGVYVSDFKVSNFTIEQSDIDKLEYSFNMTLKLKDYANTSSVSRTYEINNTLDISGLVDPALARESRDRGADTIYREFFFNKTRYASPGSGSTEVTEIQNGQGGQGWLYAPLALATGEIEGVVPSATNPNVVKHRYILVGTFSEIESVDGYRNFAGYIITSPPTRSPTACEGKEEESDTFNPIEYSEPPECKAVPGTTPSTAKPFIVAPGFTVTEDLPDCRVLVGTGYEYQKCVLFVNGYAPNDVGKDPEKKNQGSSGIYDIEDIRDFVMCGYYTHNPDAPSYMQHLLDEPYSRNSTEFGIETFVIGEYANNTEIYNLNSRLDRELFDGVDGIKIRGLPGCKDFSMCSVSPETGIVPTTGIFAASPAVIDEYGLDDIDCGEGAGCG